MTDKMDPNRGKKTNTPPKSSSIYSVHGTSQAPSQIAPAASSLTILSSILRSPHPSLAQKITTQKPQEVVSAALGQLTAQNQRSRGHSPIRVITTTINPGGSGVSSKGVVGSSISPSRIPTTLPPKKSLSPSRTIYTEAQAPSPKHRIVIPQRNTSPSNQGQSQGQSRAATAQILSHLPYLQQTLQGGTPDSTTTRIFQQIKTARKPQPGGEPQLAGHGVVGSSLPASQQQQLVQKVLERASPPPPGPQPKRAHQSQRTTPPPHHVSTIRRTPSPAHMQIGADTKAKVLVEHLSTSQAMNLIKTTEGVTKDGREVKWTEGDFKYGDLLKSINKSHDAIQAPLLQRGLSPITPADPGGDPSKAWLSQPHVHMSAHTVGGHVDVRLAQSQAQAPPPHGFAPPPSSSTHPPTSATLHHAAAAVAPTTHVSHVPVPVLSQAPYSSLSSVGFTPVVLPSASSHGQKPGAKAPVRQSTSPKARSSSAVSSSAMSSAHSIASQQPAVSYVHVPVSSVVSRPEVKVYPGVNRYAAATSLDTSVTQGGPPNITISSCGSIIPQDKILTTNQKHPKNPFTFPATPPVSLTNERPLGRPPTQTSQSKVGEIEPKKERHVSDEMPHLMPMSPASKIKREQIKEELEGELVEIPQPYNMRLQNLANFPNNSTYRPTYRATSVAIHKAKVACITNSAKSLDILRQNLQKSMNKEIDAVIQSYMNKYFKFGIDNIRLNNGETSVTEDHIQAVCRQILEEAKKMYILDRVSVSPVRDLSDNTSETGSSGRRSATGRKRHPSDTDSEKSLRPGHKKKKGRFIGSLTGRSTPSKLSLQQCKREGPKFEPERLTEDTLFVMGSKANKAMGFGATRGRLYMKHPDLFKYGGDQDDKTWLYEHQHMPATGGKSYLIVMEDIKELVLTDEYRDAPGINFGVMQAFRVPMWMIEKMRVQMVAMRTDLPKQPRYRSRSATPNPTEPNFLNEVEDGQSPPKDLPFSSFSSPKDKPSAIEASPNHLEFLAGAADNDDPTSPFNMTGGFDDTASQSDVDTIEDEGAFHIAQ